jgi:Thioesterase-like superfamily
MQSPTSPFDELCSVERVGPTHFTVTFPDQWQQGRGAYGGLVTAVLVRALEALAPDRPLRSLTSELCGPTMPGEATLTGEVLRQGSAVTTVTLRLTQNGEVQAHAVGVLGKARANVSDRRALTPPTMTPWRDVEVIPVEPPMGPVFAQHFEFRSTTLPFSGGPPRVEGWVRPRRPGVARDAAFLAGCIDSFWPVEFMVLEAPRPMATIAFTFQPLGHLVGLDPEAPLYFRSNACAATEGYAVEFRELWGHDGRLLALNQQTMVTIK